jgi:hypothetical protein
MKTLFGKIVLVLSLLIAAHAEAAQESNPLFLEASDLAEQLNASSLNDNVKTAFRTRFENLKQEQQDLWVLAGQVDGGQCIESCIDLYNSRISIWESKLRSFSEDARRWMDLQTKSDDPMWVKKCHDKCYKTREECNIDCRDNHSDELNRCKQQCWDRSVICINKGC